MAVEFNKAMKIITTLQQKSELKYKWKRGKKTYFLINSINV